MMKFGLLLTLVFALLWWLGQLHWPWYYVLIPFFVFLGNNIVVLLNGIFMSTRAFEDLTHIRLKIKKEAGLHN